MSSISFPERNDVARPVDSGAKPEGALSVDRRGFGMRALQALGIGAGTATAAYLGFTGKFWYDQAGDSSENNRKAQEILEAAMSDWKKLGHQDLSDQQKLPYYNSLIERLQSFQTYRAEAQLKRLLPANLGGGLPDVNYMTTDELVVGTQIPPDAFKKVCDTFGSMDGVAHRVSLDAATRDALRERERPPGQRVAQQ